MSIEIILQLTGVCQYPNGTTFNYQETEVFATLPALQDRLQAMYDYDTTDGYDSVPRVTLVGARKFIQEYCHEEFDRMVALAEKTGMEIDAILSSN